MRNKIILALVALIALCGQTFAADQITGVSVYAVSGYYGPFTPASCIDGTGMDIGGVPDTAQLSGGYWYDPSGASWITVDLGGVGSVDEIKIWNLNHPDTGTYDWRYAQVYVSLTNPNFDNPAEYQNLGEIDIPQAPGNDTTPYGSVYNITHTGNIRYVKLVLNSSWGGATGNGGLSEIKFYGAVTPPVVPLTLVGYWPLNGNADDASGNSNNGSIVGGLTYTAGQVGQCAQFNGIDSGITIANPANFEFTDEISISFWVNQDDVAQNMYAMVLNKMNNVQAAVDGWMIFTGQGAWEPTGMNPWFKSTLPGYGYGTTPSCVNAWHHVVVTIKGSDFTHYLDGKLWSSLGADLNGSMTVGAGYPLAFGQKSNPAGDMGSFWAGKLDEVRYYHGTLSEEDVKNLFVQGGGILCDGPTIPEDLNKDCKVNFADFAQMATKWLECYVYNNFGCE
ncbi:MAG: hypothetical protein A2Y12_01700 [Planctomycetes bacterium GWF2_42_9]|nr:MAG: hypothetical protein A2Y12_01700 [Planctomycetes bacterium GWF2_42_9]HAL45673.1 hypothetical protein [Phycisphaerales bacterium]